MTESAGQEAFHHFSRSGDQDIVMVRDPLIGGKLKHQGFIQPSGSPVIDLLERGQEAKVGLLEAGSQLAISPLGRFLVHQQAQTFFESQSAKVRCKLQFISAGPRTPLFRLS